MNTLEDIEDKTSQWKQKRLGKFTASRMGDLMVNGRKKDEYFGQKAMNYIYEKLSEKLTGIPKNNPETIAIDWGNTYEPIAIECYKTLRGIDVDYMGGENPIFIDYKNIAGGSPDGQTKESLIEVKCPFNSGNHLKMVLEDVIDVNYLYQCQANMIFTGKKLCDFISYDPRMPDNLQFYTKIIKSDEKIQEEIITRINKAFQLLIELEERITNP